MKQPMNPSAPHAADMKVGSGLATPLTGVTPPLWRRFLALLLALFAIKAWLLAGLAGHLHLEHWRVDFPAPEGTP